MRRGSVCTLFLMGIVLAGGLAWWCNRTLAQEPQAAPPPAPVHDPSSSPLSPVLEVHENKGGPVLPLPAAVNSQTDPLPPPEKGGAVATPSAAGSPSTIPAMQPVTTNPGKVQQTNESMAGAAPMATPPAVRPPALVPVKDENPVAAWEEKPKAFRLLDAPPAPAPLPVVRPKVLAAERLAVAANGVAAVPVTATSPALAVEKIAPATVTLNQPARYEIVVRNLGAAPAVQVHLEDQLPPDARYLSATPPPELAGDRLIWNFTNLEVGGQRRLRVEFTPTRELESLPAALVAYAVVAQGRIHTRTPPPEPRREPARLLVRTSGPGTVAVGQPAVFQIEVSNPGDAPANDLVLRDRLPPGLRHPQGTEIEADLGALGPHETRKVTLSALAVKPGRQINETIVSGPNGLTARGEAAVEVTGGGLRISQTGPNHGWVGQEVEFRIDINNGGATNVTSLRVQDMLPVGLEFVAAPEGGHYDPASRRVTWQVPVLPAGQSRIVVLKLKPTLAGDQVNRITAQAEQGDVIRSEATVKIGGMAALGLDVANPEKTVEIGKDTTYEIRVSNHGSLAGTGVLLLVTVPDGMEPRNAAGPSRYRIQGQQVIFGPLAQLEAGKDGMYRVTVRCMTPGDKRVRAQLTSDQAPLPFCKEEVTWVYSDRN